jgi:hypothetical protein
MDSSPTSSPVTNPVVVTDPSTSLPSTDVDAPTGTVTEPSATTLPAAGVVTPDPVNIYALAGARAIVERVKENDLSGLDAIALSEALLEAIDAAYEIEYPSVVTYLDVAQDDDANLVVVTEDESQTQIGTAYVCVSGNTVVASEQACDSSGS